MFIMMMYDGTDYVGEIMMVILIIKNNGCFFLNSTMIYLVLSFESFSSHHSSNLMASPLDACSKFAIGSFLLSIVDMRPFTIMSSANLVIFTDGSFDTH